MSTCLATAAGGPLRGSQEPVAPPWTPRDVVDSRIDVQAQRSLIRMFERGGDPATAASAILAAVKDGQLAGIYQQDQRAPALRAQGIGKGWWQLFDGVPPERGAMCWTEPASAAPMIVLRRGVKSGAGTLDLALREAWEQCGLPAAAPRPYSGATQPAQQSPGGSPSRATAEPWERTIDWDGQFASHYDNCWTQHPLAADGCQSFRSMAGNNDAAAVAYLLGTACNRPPDDMPRALRAQLKACCTAAGRARDAVDACVTARVHAFAHNASGASPTALQTVKRRYADWKRRMGKP